jgi:predicted alpha/beta-fold hydrolase
MTRSTRLSTGLTELSMLSGGFPTRELYFKQADLTGKYQLIKKPFFFLSSLDDQFFGSKVIPYDQVSEHILLGVTKAGSHVGYIEGTFLPTGQWHTKPCFAFLNHFMQKAIENERLGSLSNSSQKLLLIE